MDLQAITNELYYRNLIDQETYNKMNEVRKLRNPFHHNDLAFKITSSQAADAETKAIKALDCVKILKAKYDDSLNK